jgi:hypothetical protein
VAQPESDARAAADKGTADKPAPDKSAAALPPVRTLYAGRRGKTAPKGRGANDDR